jgi:hypothetical protein
MIGGFVCECYNGFEFNITTGQCVDINECSFEKDIGKSICQSDPLHEKSCENTCGNYTCQCLNTQKTVVDIYEPTKCYQSKKLKNEIKFKFKNIFFVQGNETRDFILYFYLKRDIVDQIFYKNINITLMSCFHNETINDNDKTVEFEIEFNSFHQFLTTINGQHWLPTYIDNSEWSDLEFICNIQVKLLSIIGDTKKDFEYVLVEDSSRRRCSMYSLDTINDDDSSPIDYTRLSFNLGN